MVEKEKDKELGLFENRQCKIKIETKTISVMDSYENYLIIGDEKGMAYSYDMNEKTGDCISEAHAEISSGKIEQIKCHANLNIAFLLIGGYVYVVTIPKLEKIHKSEVKDIVKFVVNQHSSRVNELVFITKKRKMKFRNYSHEMRKFIESTFEESYAPEIPDLAEWYKDYIIILSKKKSAIIGCSSGKMIPVDDSITYSKSCGSSWLMYTNGTGIFMDKNIPKPQNTIDFGNKPLISINTFKNFVISLHDSILKVFDGSDSANIQDVLFHHGSLGKFLITTNKRVLYLVQNLNEKTPENQFQLFELRELAFEKQISKLVSEEKYEDALAILNHNISNLDEDKPKKLEIFFMDCAWSYFRKCNFKKAAQHFKLTNYDPFLLILIFHNELKTIFKDNKFQKHIDGKTHSIEYITSNNQNLIKEGLDFLCDLLISKRKYFTSTFLNSYSGGDLNKALNSNFLIQFTVSDKAVIKVKNEMNFKNMMTLVNTSLIKSMILNKSKCSKLRELILESENFFWDEEDLNNFINKSDSVAEAKIAMAYIYEKKESWDKSLKIWQEFGMKREENFELSMEACDRTNIIINKSKDSDLMKEYISWILVKFTDNAFQLFHKTNLISTEYFYTSIIGVIDKTNSDMNLKEKFLEFYLSSGSTTERYHTMICDLYIEKLFKLKKPNLEYTDSSTFEGNIKLIYEKLNNIVHTSLHYNKLHVLEKIKDTWLVDMEVYLYSQLNMHAEAIAKLIAYGCSEDNFDKSEKYCNEIGNNKTELFTEYFKSLTNQYNLCSKAISNSKNEKEKTTLEKQGEIFKKQMLYILKKYGDTQKLDVFMIMESLPGDWLLTEKDLYDYLVKVIKTCNHMSNKYKLAKSLSEMSLLYKERDLIEAKGKSVNISNETNCEFCKKKIGATIFVVYPNMKIYHTKCAQNLTICPTSRVDFTKNIYS